MGPPSRRQINVHDSLDEQSACKHFLGRTVEQAEALFVENSLKYQDYLVWMGPVAFCYYVQAAIRYIQSEKAAGASDMVSGFADILEFRLERRRTKLLPVAEDLASVCRYIVDRYDTFELTPEIYGDVRSRFVSLAEEFSKMAKRKRNA